MQLLFVRHAESTGNQAQRMQGQADFELSLTGQQQAEKLAKRLFAEGWCPDHIYSSPLKRAQQTAQVLIKAFEPLAVASVGTPTQLEFAEELKELHNGVFQGLTWQEARTAHPDLCRELETSLDVLPIPGAEPLNEVRDRARAFVQRLLQRHRNRDRVWIITHGGILQFLVAELLGCDRTWGLSIRSTALFEFWLDCSRWPLNDQNRWNTALWQIRRFNDTQHLEP